MTCFFRHAWSKWVPEERKNSFTMTAGPLAGKFFEEFNVHQSRQCSVCGRLQVEWVHEGRLPEAAKQQPG